MKKKRSIVLNDETVRSLKQHLKNFDNDAKLVIHFDNALYGVVIGCNFEWQEENNTVSLLIGELISRP